MLTERALNRTLLQRQHLLERTSMEPLAMVEHLLGLQAQEPLPPYLSLFARLEDFDPQVLSKSLESRQTVRLLVMRGTIHTLTADDALTLRPFTQPLLTKVIKSTDWGRGFPLEMYDDVVARTRAALVDGPLPVKQLGEVLAEAYPDRSPSDCGNLARSLVPLVQVPPRGLWKQPGGQVYETLETWLGEELREPDRAEIVRRYLRAYGPATPADVTTWSGTTGIREIFAALGDELVTLIGPDGKTLWDLQAMSVATGEEHAPVRMLGRYDNVWLSHASRERVTTPEKRKKWMGTNGGIGFTIFVDGWLEGTWSQTPAGKVDVTLHRELTKAEHAELAAEIAAVEKFLAS
ncbi:MAG TPA: winged helix DNA-binding domain-containing protein [Nocardioidaceae bacterium]|nr:winged helix DNA-binding domain-containing protein [Nocardioidaceae bacterium]